MELILSIINSISSTIATLTAIIVVAYTIKKDKEFLKEERKLRLLTSQKDYPFFKIKKEKNFKNIQDMLIFPSESYTDGYGLYTSILYNKHGRKYTYHLSINNGAVDKEKRFVKTLTFKLTNVSEIMIKYVKLEAISISIPNIPRNEKKVLPQNKIFSTGFSQDMNNGIICSGDSFLFSISIFFQSEYFAKNYPSDFDLQFIISIKSLSDITFYETIRLNNYIPEYEYLEELNAKTIHTIYK